MVRQLIESLTGISVSTDDLEQLMQYPEQFTEDEEAANRLKELFDLMEATQRWEGEERDDG